MPTVDFGACVSNYWFIWSINGLGSIFGIAINMTVSFFFLKYFHNLASNTPSAPKKPKSSFFNFRHASPVTNMSPGSWANDSTISNPLDASRA